MTEPMAPPPPPPPPPAPPASSGMKWLIGCGLGCLVAVILIVVVVIGVSYFAVTKLAPQGVTTAYQQLKQEGKVPAEYQAQFDRLVALGTGSEASIMATGLAGAVTMQILQDGAVSPDEQAALQDALALLESNPDLSATQLGEFFEKHPQYQSGVPQFGLEDQQPVESAPPEEPAPDMPPAEGEVAAPEPAPDMPPPAEGEAPAPEPAPAPAEPAPDAPATQ